VHAIEPRRRVTGIPPTGDTGTRCGVWQSGEESPRQSWQTVLRAPRFGSTLSHFIELRFRNNRKTICIDQNTTDFPIDGIADYVKKTYTAAANFREIRP
jgi:hypothetical protein